MVLAMKILTVKILAVKRLSTSPVAALLLCGIAFPCLALGGHASGKNAALAPHLVMVLGRAGQRHNACTGSIVSRSIILTAAHCVAGKRDVVIAYAENGSHVLQRVKARAIHPGFSDNARVSIDLALLQLEGALPARFQPVTLDDGAGVHAVGASQIVAGFGLETDGDEASAGILRSARVSVLPKLYPRFLRLGQAAGGGLDDFAICTGDSGGPVFATTGASPLQVGVVYGREAFEKARSCGVTAQAVRIAPQRGWIDGVLARWSGQAANHPPRP